MLKIGNDKNLWSFLRLLSKKIGIGKAVASNAAVALKYSEKIRESDAEKFRAIASATTQMTALTEDLLLLARTDTAPLQKEDRVNLTILYL